MNPWIQRVEKRKEEEREYVKKQYKVIKSYEEVGSGTFQTPPDVQVDREQGSGQGDCGA